MGALVARSLVEADTIPARDVGSLIMIAPVNQGSNLAKVQTVVQLLNGLQAINGKKTTNAMLHLSDGMGQAADGHVAWQSLLEGTESTPAADRDCLSHTGGRQRLSHSRDERSDRGAARRSWRGTPAFSAGSPRWRRPTCRTCSTS